MRKRSRKKIVGVRPGAGIQTGKGSCSMDALTHSSPSKSSSLLPPQDSDQSALVRLRHAFLSILKISPSFSLPCALLVHSRHAAKS